MNGIGTQTIETKRLILRKIKKEDYTLAYKNWTSDPLVTKYLTWDTHKNETDTKAYIEWKATRYEGHEYCFDWIVILKETDEPIGEIEAIEVSRLHKLVEMGYCFGSKFWNNGYGSEALKAFIEYMFSKVEVDKIIACHISTNPASGKAMLKAGMHFDASLKNYFIDKNTGLRADKVCYSIDRNNIE